LLFVEWTKWFVLKFIPADINIQEIETVIIQEISFL